MSVVFVIAIVSGVVLYRPFMRKLDFATVRRRRSPRVTWLDLLAIVLLGSGIYLWLGRRGPSPDRPGTDLVASGAEA